MLKLPFYPSELVLPENEHSCREIKLLQLIEKHIQLELKTSRLSFLSNK